MPYLGDFFIILALVLSIVSLGSYALAWRGQVRFHSLGRLAFVGATAAVTATLGVLMYLILTHDFTVAYVWQYSSTDLPLGFLISTLWGGQQGTFLLWLFYVVVMGTLLFQTAGKFENGTMVFLNLFVISLLTILVKKSPFELLPDFRLEGAGLNPLLQNFWMQIHPPIMFVGFAAAAFPFFFGMVGLFERNYVAWSEAARKWTLFAWATLGVSLVMGGYWAYETLGWGGFWAWDPVENSSLIPWLFLTTQIHALFIKQQRKGLLRFSLVAVCLSFWSVLYGTFLTRSGVLADFSVHSFVDLGINAFLASGLIFFIAIGLFALLLRWNDIKPQPSFSAVISRSYAVTLGVVSLFLAAVLVLIGTSAPLLTRVTDNPSNVSMSYYFSTITPIAVLILLLIATFPSLRWNHGLSRLKLLFAGAGAGLLVALAVFASGISSQALYLALFAAGTWAIVSNGWVLIDSIRRKHMVAGYLSHIGLAVALIGATTSAGFEQKEIVRLPQGSEVSALGYRFVLDQVADTRSGFDCHVTIHDGNSTIAATLPHEFPKNADGVMKRPFVHSSFMHDLYLAPQAFEPPTSEDPGLLSLTKGESKTLGPYTFTFSRFDMGGSHGENEAHAMSASALVSVSKDGYSESVSPSLRVLPDSIHAEPARFDNGAGTISIAGVRPEDGGVALLVQGSFVPKVAGSLPVLVLDVSRKPLIILFWIGTFLIFIGGFISLLRARAKRSVELEERTVSSPPVAASH